MPAVEILDQDAGIAQRRERFVCIGEARKDEIGRGRVDGNARKHRQSFGQAGPIRTNRGSLRIERRPFGEQDRQGQGSGLPQFRNQPEMSAQEASSVLAAVENLERQQRREQAARRARQNAAKGKDW